MEKLLHYIIYTLAQAWNIATFVCVPVVIIWLGATWAIRYGTHPSCHRKPHRWFISLGMMLSTVILDAAYCLCVREYLLIYVEHANCLY